LNISSDSSFLFSLFKIKALEDNTRSSSGSTLRALFNVFRDYSIKFNSTSTLLCANKIWISSGFYAVIYLISLYAVSNYL